MAKGERRKFAKEKFSQEGLAGANTRGLDPSRGRGGRRGVILGLFLGLLLGMLCQAGFTLQRPTPAASGPLLEDLRYQVDIWVWKDAARSQITLKSLGEGRYLAELSGRAQGFLGVISGQRRDSYQTEMVWSQGELRPVVYREESLKRGKRSLKEYRFDYGQGRVEMWQWKESQGIMVKKWQAPLEKPMYDPLSAFYNLRLGTLGPWKEGDILKVTGIPYPRPDEIEVRIGPATKEGRLAMVSFFAPSFENERAMIHVLADGGGVPLQAWTRVLSFGKIAGQLLPDSKSLNGGLPESSSRPGNSGSRGES